MLGSVGRFLGNGEIIYRIVTKKARSCLEWAFFILWAARLLTSPSRFPH